QPFIRGHKQLRSVLRLGDPKQTDFQGVFQSQIRKLSTDSAEFVMMPIMGQNMPETAPFMKQLPGVCPALSFGFFSPNLQRTLPSNLARVGQRGTHRRGSAPVAAIR
ncbi:MAG: hypothetical protein WA705_08800, partial [Candidatus Ozemobacteraceae bacterium]